MWTSKPQLKVENELFSDCLVIYAVHSLQLGNAPHVHISNVAYFSPLCSKWHDKTHASMQYSEANAAIIARWPRAASPVAV
jgi:hypothetical protein